MRPTYPADPTSHPFDFYTAAYGTYHVDYLWHLTDAYVSTTVLLPQPQTKKKASKVKVVFFTVYLR